MSFSLVLLSVCVAFFVWRGWHLGLSKVLQQCLASLFGLVASTLATPILAPVAAPVLGLTSAWLLLGILIFIAVFIGSKRVLSLLLEPLQFAPVFKRGGGLVLNAGVGLLLGGFLVWSLAFVSSISTLSLGHFVRSEQTPLEAAAGRGMAAAAWLSAKGSGLPENQARLLAMVCENPSALISDIQHLAVAPSLMSLLRNAEAQLLMQARNLPGLQETPVFKAFWQEPAAQDLIARLENAGYPAAREVLAQQLLTIWAGFDVIARDELILRFVAQAQLVENLQQGNFYAVVTHPEFPRVYVHLKMLLISLFKG